MVPMLIVALSVKQHPTIDDVGSSHANATEIHELAGADQSVGLRDR